MSFKLIVLRFMAIVLKAQWLGDWSVADMRTLHDDIENEIENRDSRGVEADGD